MRRLLERSYVLQGMDDVGFIFQIAASKLFFAAGDTLIVGCG